MKTLNILFIFFMLFFLGSCVSKKKYAQLQKTYEMSVIENGNKSRSLSGYADSLIWAMNHKDSIIDSLSIKLMEFNTKKEKQKIIYSKRKSSLTKEQEYNKKAVYIYNFAKNIYWPSTYNGIQFVIGVTGDETILKELKKVLADKKVGGKTVIVKEFVKGTKYNMVYIDSGHSNEFNSIKEYLKKNKTVLITDEQNLNAFGAHISFIIDKDNIRFNINKPAIEKAGMKVSEELMRFAE